MRSCCVLLLCVAVVALAVPEGVRPEGHRTQLLPCCMVRYSTPIKVCAVLGVSFNRMTGYHDYGGFFIQAEPGFGGGKLNVGYRFGACHFMPIWNVGLSGSLMQTWGDPLQDVEAGQTYAGLELSAAFSVIGINGGVFTHMAGDDEEHDWIYSLGVGVGF
ncbi:hypothetical protein JW921_02235 [Candidatus Fermentibacterales bacterium]|nr:hypothetical protein [Candidatus Fermentibacterales bacterium]